VAAVPFPGSGAELVDVVGTGGDGVGTFNISTGAALVAAGAGAKVAKHGNRAISSRCGSADVLEALGVRIDLTPESNYVLLEETGFAFFFAPLYHPSFRHAGPVRRELGVRTIFNFLGPLANPARAERQAIGVSDPVMAENMIGVLSELGARSSFVFCGDGNVDEVTTSGPTIIHRLRDGEVTTAEFTPEDFGVERVPISELSGGDADLNASLLRAIFDGEAGARTDAVVVNAAPALVAAGLAPGFEEGVALARESIRSGAAASVLARVAERSQALGGD
jgi:anthranilate phosphoribosyltransferase